MRKRRIYSALAILIALGVILSACMYLNRPSYIYLVRHGKTYANEQGIMMGGGGNADLLMDSVKQSYALGEVLGINKFDKVYTSTLGRTVDTATHILKGTQQDSLKVNQLELLNDISWGDVEGLTQEEYMHQNNLESFPEAFGDANDSQFVSPVRAETKYMFCKRFQQGMDEIVKEIAPGEEILVVAHSSMQFWLEQKFPETQGGHIDNLSITVIKVVGNEMELVEYNRRY